MNFFITHSGDRCSVIDQADYLMTSLSKNPLQDMAQLNGTSVAAWFGIQKFLDLLPWCTTECMQYAS